MGACSPQARTSIAMASPGDSEITLFDGTIVAKPSSESGARRPASVASEESSRSTGLEGIEGSLLGTERHGDNVTAPAGSNGVGIGLPRFQPLLPARREEEVAEHVRDGDDDGSVSVAGVAARINRCIRASQDHARDHGAVSSSQLRAPSHATQPPLSGTPGVFTPGVQRLFSSSPDPSSVTPGRKRPRTPTGPLVPSTSESPWSTGLDALGGMGGSSGGTPTISQGLSAAGHAVAGSNLPNKTGSVFATPPSRPGTSWDDVRKGADVASPSDREGASHRSNRRTPSRHEGRGNHATAAEISMSVPAGKSRPRSPRGTHARSPKSPREAPCPGPPVPRPLTLDDFAGADEVCFNPGERRPTPRSPCLAVVTLSKVLPMCN